MIQGFLESRKFLHTLLIVALSFEMVLCSTCPTFTAWLNVGNEVQQPQCGYGPCSNLDGFASVDVAPDASYIVFTVQISNSRVFVTTTQAITPFSSAIPGSMSAFVYGPAPPGKEVTPGTAPLFTMDLDPLSLSMNTIVTRVQLAPTNLDTVLRLFERFIRFDCVLIIAENSKLMASLVVRCDLMPTSAVTFGPEWPT